MTEDQKLAAVNAAVASDPELQQLVQRFISNDSTGVTSLANTPETLLNQRLQQMGVEIPKAWKLGADGKAAQQSWFQRNMDWVVPGLILGGGLGGAYATGALGASGAAGGGASVPALASGVPEGIGGASALPTLGSLAAGGGATGTGAGFLATDIGNVANSVSGAETLGAGPALNTIPRLASGANPAITAATAGGGGGSTLAQIARYAVPGVSSVLANRQLNGANNDANAALQQATQQGLDLNQGVYNNSMGAAQNAYNTVSGGYQPYQAIGQQGLNSLASLAGQNRPDLQRRADFTLPTLEQARAMPGYQFGLDQGIRGVNSTAAARGGLLTGGAVKAADKFATDYATSKYDTLANQALNAYTTNANNDLNVYNANTANFDRPFNQAATLASLGQYGTTGAATAANNLANQTINAGGQYGQNATNLLTAGANANAANSVNNGRNNAGTALTLGNLIEQYFSNRGL